MSTAKQTLKYHLETRINYLVSDSRTFLWAKFVHKKTFDKQNGIGGGNFLIVIGNFACLNLLSKVYWLLSKNPDDYLFVSKETKKEFENQVKDIRRKLDKDRFELFLKYGFQGIRLGFQINEKVAFVNLVSDLYKDGIDLGLKDEKIIIERAWDNLRISFSHYAVPGGGKIAAFVKDKKDNMRTETFNEIVESLEKTNMPPFLIEKNGDIIVLSDLLNQYVKRINNWLSSKIDAASEVQVAACLKEIKV